MQNPALLREIQNAQALLTIQENHIASLDWWVKMVSDENRIYIVSAEGAGGFHTRQIADY